MRNDSNLTSNFQLLGSFYALSSRPSLQIPLPSCSPISTRIGRNLKMATSPRIFASTASPQASIRMRSLVFEILPLLALNASDGTGHL